MRSTCPLGPRRPGRGHKAVLATVAASNRPPKPDARQQAWFCINSALCVVYAGQNENKRVDRPVQRRGKTMRCSIRITMLHSLPSVKCKINENAVLLMVEASGPAGKRPQTSERPTDTTPRSSADLSRPITQTFRRRESRPRAPRASKPRLAGSGTAAMFKRPVPLKWTLSIFVAPLPVAP
jgi:hypothetical protein